VNELDGEKYINIITGDNKPTCNAYLGIIENEIVIEKTVLKTPNKKQTCEKKTLY
jgi:hypothetical protein